MATRDTQPDERIPELKSSFFGARILDMPHGEFVKRAQLGDIPAYLMPDGTVKVDRMELVAWLQSRRTGKEATQ